MTRNCQVDGNLFSIYEYVNGMQVIKITTSPDDTQQIYIVMFTNASVTGVESFQLAFFMPEQQRTKFSFRISLIHDKSSSIQSL